jgi:hypothetical protein
MTAGSSSSFAQHTTKELQAEQRQQQVHGMSAWYPGQQLLLQQLPCASM